jgi:hypothetical protein
MAQPEDQSATAESDYIRIRLAHCLVLIDGTPHDPASQKALIWILIEELLSILKRAWRAAR